MLTCKAAVALEAKKDLVIQDIQVCEPKAGEVRVKILYTGVCHTDESMRIGLDPSGNFPCILGHEGAGIVESIGEGVTSLEVGDHVIPLYMAQCRECKFCKSSKSNLCEKIRFTQRTGSTPDGTSCFKDMEGNSIADFFATSTFSQYTVVPEIACAKINKSAPLDKVCLLGCGITTGYGAVINTLKIEKGATVAVIGLGGVGLASVMGAVKVGASKIIGVDINPDKFPKAIEFGCTDVINPLEHKDKELPELIFDLTDGVGVDYSIECVGSTHIMKQAFLSTKPNGGASCAIGVTPFEHNIELQSEDVCGREWTGCVFGDAKSLDMIPQYVDEYMNCEIKLDEFITHNFDLQDINQAFHELHSGKCIKSIIKMFDDE